jgi:hypothetical protein
MEAAGVEEVIFGGRRAGNLVRILALDQLAKMIEERRTTTVSKVLNLIFRIKTTVLLKTVIVMDSLEGEEGSAVVAKVRNKYMSTITVAKKNTTKVVTITVSSRRTRIKNNLQGSWLEHQGKLQEKQGTT